jgi:GT2 family glycosyltransferase
MIYVILVNWNGFRDTIECLESLLRVDHHDISVIVIDNASTDGSIDHIREWAEGFSTPSLTGPPWQYLPSRKKQDLTFDIVSWAAEFDDKRRFLTVIRADENLGFAGANNLGMTYALKDRNANFFWILNNDTVVHPTAITPLETRMKTDKEIGIIGSRLMYYDTPTIVQGLGGWFSPYRARGAHLGQGAIETKLPDPKEVERRQSYVIGAAMFVRRSVIEQIGAMSDQYFLYFEELDWSMRLCGKFKLAYCQDSIVYHKEGASIGASSSRKTNATRTYYLSVNLLRFFLMHYKIFIFFAIARIFRECLSDIAKYDFHSVCIRMMAIKDFVTDRYRRGPISNVEFFNAKGN